MKIHRCCRKKISFGLTHTKTYSLLCDLLPVKFHINSHKLKNSSLLFPFQWVFYFFQSSLLACTFFSFIIFSFRFTFPIQFNCQCRRVSGKVRAHSCLIFFCMHALHPPPPFPATTTHRTLTFFSTCQLLAIVSHSGIREANCQLNKDICFVFLHVSCPFFSSMLIG